MRQPPSSPRPNTASPSGGVLPRRIQRYRFDVTKPTLFLRHDAVVLHLDPQPIPTAVTAGAIAFVVLGVGLAFVVGDPIGVLLCLLFACTAAYILLSPSLTAVGLHARIADGIVRVTEDGNRTNRPNWEEPLSAYSGLHATLERWSPIVGNTIQPLGEGRLLLEHATDPDRTLLLTIAEGGPIADEFARDVARRIGVPLRRSD